MPEISRFFGIVIKMFFNEHNPPHFHAQYQKHNVVVLIKTGEIIGKFPAHGRKLLRDWNKIHQKELLENWNSAAKKGTIKKIEPLD